jgi:hypothetical protein
VVRVHEIVIDAPQITYERGKGSTNLDAIQKNIEAYVKRADAASAAEGKEKTGEGRNVSHKFVIDRLSIRGAKVTMTNPALKGQGSPSTCRTSSCATWASARAGSPRARCANAVASTLISRIAQRVLTNIDLLRKGGVDGAIDAVEGIVQVSRFSFCCRASQSSAVHPDPAAPSMAGLKSLMLVSR